MRTLYSMCRKCGGSFDLILESPYPEFGETFMHFCRCCGEDTEHTLILTKKLAKQLRRQEAERGMSWPLPCS